MSVEREGVLTYVFVPLGFRPLERAVDIGDFNIRIPIAKIVLNNFRQVACDHNQTLEPVAAQGAEQPFKDGDSIDFNKTFGC